MNRLRHQAPATWLHITLSDKSLKLFSTIRHLEGESCSTNGPQWWSFTFTKSCEISLAQIHSDTGCWMKIVPLFEVTLLVHMVPAATHANGDLCFVTQFQAVGVNECLIKQNNGYWVFWPRRTQWSWTVYIVKVKTGTQSERPSKYCDAAQRYISKTRRVWLLDLPM